MQSFRVLKSERFPVLLPASLCHEQLLHDWQHDRGNESLVSVHGVLRLEYGFIVVCRVACRRVIVAYRSRIVSRRVSSNIDELSSYSCS